MGIVEKEWGLPLLDTDNLRTPVSVLGIFFVGYCEVFVFVRQCEVFVLILLFFFSPSLAAKLIGP